MNIVMICLDTYRADCARAAGRNSFIRTPHMDRLIEEGVLFENAFGEGLPTIQYRRALITGMRSFPFNTDRDTIGCWPNVPGWHGVLPEQATLAEILAARPTSLEALSRISGVGRYKLEKHGTAVLDCVKKKKKRGASSS